MASSPSRAPLAALVLETLRLGGTDRLPTLAERWAALTPRETSAVAALATHERAATWLLRRLGDRGALDRVPAALVAELRQRARRDAALAMRVDAQAEALLALLDAWGVPAVLLKGVARRAGTALYPYADARGTIDVDVLVPANAAREVHDRLRREGYDFAAPPEATPEGLYHLRPLTRNGEPTVELHTSTSNAVPATEAWRRANEGATDLSWQGRRVRIPAATELLWHAVAHAVQDDTSGFSLRYYLDAAVVLASGRAVHWESITERLRGPELPDAALAALWLRGAADLAGTDGADAQGAARLAPGPWHLASESPVLPELAWRLAVFARVPRASRWREKLLDEGTRAQLGLPQAPLVASRSFPIAVRRRAATLAARAVYGAWRAARR